MAQDQNPVTCVADDWTQLTNADVTEISFQVLSGAVYIRYTTDTTKPTEPNGQLHTIGEGPLQVELTTLTYLSGAARVWAKPAHLGVTGGLPKAVVWVDHA